MEKKITKEMKFEAIKAMVANAEAVEVGDVTITAQDIITFANESQAQLKAKAEKAKEKAAEKKAASDVLREKVAAVLTTELQTREDIFGQIEDVAELTVAKVGARLTQLVEAGFATKELIKVGDRRLTAYKLA